MRTNFHIALRHCKRNGEDVWVASCVSVAGLTAQDDSPRTALVMLADQLQDFVDQDAATEIDETDP